MNDNTIMAVSVEGHSGWVKTQTEVVDLIRLRMGRKGVEMTELEAWQYLAWCLDAVLGVIRAQNPPVVTALQGAMAANLAVRYREERTGVWEPPVGARFESPQDLSDKIAAQDVGDERADHGYL